MLKVVASSRDAMENTPSPKRTSQEHHRHGAQFELSVIRMLMLHILRADLFDQAVSVKHHYPAYRCRQLIVLSQIFTLSHHRTFWTIILLAIIMNVKSGVYEAVMTICVSDCSFESYHSFIASSHGMINSIPKTHVT
jgi:hypothetical protein